MNTAPKNAASGGLAPALLIAAFAIIGASLALYAPPATGEMAVVFPLSTSEQAAYSTVVAAGGRFVSGTKFDNIVVAYALDADFDDRVRALGGLFVLAARGLCAPASTPQEQAI